MAKWMWYSKVLFALAVLAFLWMVWPRPWSYHRIVVEDETTIGRVSRLTGTVEFFDPYEGNWVRKR